MTWPGTAAALAFLTGFAPNLSIAAASAAWLGLAVVWLVSLARRKEVFTPVRTAMDGALALYLGIWLLAALCGIDALGSLQKFQSQTRFLVFYLLLWSFAGRSAAAALRGYLWGAGTAVAYGLAQYVFWQVILQDQPPAWFGELGRSAQHYISLHTGRVHGAVHPLTYAETITPALLFFAVSYLESEGRRRWAWFGALCAAGAAMILSQSRGPWLGAAAGLVLITAFHRRRIRLAPFIALAGLLLTGMPDLRGRLSTLSEYKDYSSTTRLDLWRGGLYIARQHPWLGVGPGQLKRATYLYMARPEFPRPDLRYAGDMHNLYIQQLASQGILGLAALLVLLGMPFGMAFRAYRKAATEGRPEAAALLALTAYYAAFLIFNVTERAFEDAEVSLVFWVLTAATASLAARVRKSSSVNIQA